MKLNPFAEFFIGKGTNDWNLGTYGTVQDDHLEVVESLSKKEWAILTLIYNDYSK